MTPPDDSAGPPAPYEAWYGYWYPPDGYRGVTKPHARDARLNGRVERPVAKPRIHESRVPATIRNPRIPQ